jgi:hypothetical protein
MKHRLINYFSLPVCIVVTFLYLIGLVWAFASAILELFLMGVSR